MFNLVFAPVVITTTIPVVITTKIPVVQWWLYYVRARARLTRYFLVVNRAQYSLQERVQEDNIKDILLYGPFKNKKRAHTNRVVCPMLRRHETL